METLIITAFAILAGGIVLTLLERSLFVGKGKGAQMLLVLAGVLLLAHGVGLLGIPSHAMGLMMWGDFSAAAILFGAARLIPRKIGTARVLSLVGGLAMCIIPGCWIVVECGHGFMAMLNHPSFAFVAESAVVTLGGVTALMSFHLRWLDVDPYHPF